MRINLLDIAPWPGDEVNLQQQVFENIQKDFQIVEKEVSKKAKKAAKKAEKAAKKAEKAAKKAQKKAEKAAKKAQKQLKVQDLSAAPANTVTTVQASQESNREIHQAAMPTGIILTVCASLLLCMVSAWYYRRQHSRA